MVSLANQAQISFRLFRPGNFHLKDVPGRRVVDNNDKITQIIQGGRCTSSRHITKDVKMDITLHHLHEASFRKNIYLYLGANQSPSTMDKVSNCKDAFLKDDNVDRMEHVW